jgi:hypothetical protein
MKRDGSESWEGRRSLKAGEAGVQGGALIPILPDRRSRLGADCGLGREAGVWRRAGPKPRGTIVDGVGAKSKREG